MTRKASAIETWSVSYLSSSETRETTSADILYNSARLLLGGGNEIQLLVSTTPGHGPTELGGLLLLVEQGVGLGRSEDDQLSGLVNETDTMAGVDSTNQ